MISLLTRTIFKKSKPETFVWAFEKVMGVSHSLYEQELESMKDARGLQQDTDLTTEDLKELVQKYKGVYQKAIGKPFPTGTTYLSMCPSVIGAFFSVK